MPYSSHLLICFAKMTKYPQKLTVEYSMIKSRTNINIWLYNPQINKKHEQYFVERTLVRPTILNLQFV